MAASPTCSASSAPGTSRESTEAEALSDDSGVDLRPQRRTIQGLHPEVVAESRRNKRKSSEPRRRKDVLQMKRFRWDSEEEEVGSDSDDVFDEHIDTEGERPSSGDSGCQLDPRPQTDTVSIDKPPKQQWRRPQVKQETRVSNTREKSSPLRQSVIHKHEGSVLASPSTSSLSSQRTSVLSPSLSTSNSLIRPNGAPSEATAHNVIDSNVLLHQRLLTADLSHDEDPTVTFDSQDAVDAGQGTSGLQQRTARSVGRPRNYKSMSKQRRIEANARERTRVHTISAAFESLRRAVPAYAHNQKLSKLAILRIASAYIVALACLNDQDYSREQSRPNLADCVDQCTRTIQAEGRTRRRTKVELYVTRCSNVIYRFHDDNLRNSIVQLKQLSGVKGLFPLDFFLEQIYASVTALTVLPVVPK